MIISIIIIVIGLVLLINQLIISKANNNKPNNNVIDNPSICILIPARNESKVITNLLESISNQTYKMNMKDVYVIVEDENDETVKICNKLNTSYIVRKHPELQRKGYALDDAIKQISKEYDLYFIFDADNILDSKYIENMLKSYYQGYDIAIGYRDSKNGNVNLITACSSLTFSMINQLFNDRKIKNTNNVTISGTGFFIRGEYISKWHGYPFHTLTEDYELTLYSILHSLTSGYNKDAIFYDEQPTTMNVSIKQRTRWVKGFFEARKIYISKISKSLHKRSNNDGSKRNAVHIIRSVIIMVIGALLLLFSNIYLMIKTIINNGLYSKYLFNILMILLLIYLVLVLLTIIILIKEHNKLNLSTNMKIKCIFYNPFFLITYLVCVCNMFIKKDTEWARIEHTDNEIKK